MIRPILASLAATALIAPVAIHAQQVEIEAEGPVIELTVMETVKAEPDIVTIGAGVSNEERTAVAAMRANAAKMEAVIERIKALGVPEEDIQTTGINLNAQYNYNRNQPPEFRGYQVSNRVSVILRDIDETGEVLDALVVAGATDLSGPTFSIDDDTEAKDEARERAVERAQQRAEAYAQLYGYSGVRVLSISESIQGRGPVPQMAMREEVQSVDVSGSRAPVQPGMVSTGVAVTIRFEMVGGTVDGT